MVGDIKHLCKTFHKLLAIKNFKNRLRFDKVTESSKVGTFLRHSVYCAIFRLGGNS